jgi:DNA primase catalytic subunit
MKNALNLYKELKNQFSQIQIVFSGRGAHVHVFDKEAYYLTFKQRDILNKKYKKFGREKDN